MCTYSKARMWDRYMHASKYRPLCAHVVKLGLMSFEQFGPIGGGGGNVHVYMYCICTCAHAHTHKHSHTYMYTRTHTPTCTCTHIYSHIHMYMHTHSHNTDTQNINVYELKLLTSSGREFLNTTEHLLEDSTTL